MVAQRGRERSPGVLLARGVLPAAIALCVGVCFFPLLSNDFVSWDDDVALTGNVRFRGLSGTHLAWMFTTLHLGHYQPLSWLTYTLIYRTSGISPFGYHLVSLLLHAANAVVFYFVILVLLQKPSGRLADARLGAYVAATVSALFFALHPLRVEAVAWATQLRLLQCGFFLLLALLAYLLMLRADEAGGRRKAWWLGLSIGSYSLSLLSDAVGLAFPIILLALDVYPLRRFSVANRRRCSYGSVVVEKIPFVVISLATALVAFVGQGRRAMIPLDQHGVIERAVQAVYGLAFYLWKTTVPIHLSPLYLLRLPLNPTEPAYVASAFAVIGLTAGAMALRRRYPWVLLGWASYAILVAPVVGFVQSGPQIAADRYTYLPCLPWAVLVGAGIAYLLLGGKSHRASRLQTALVIAGASCVLLGLGVLSHRYARVWRDSLSLWSHAIEVDPGNSFAYNNRGTIRRTRGDLNGALADYDSAIRWNPESHAAYTNRGIVRQAKGDLNGALADYTRAIRFNPEDGRAYANRGTVRQAAGDFAGAAADYDSALNLNPDDADILYNRGTLRQMTGDREGALHDYDAAIRLSPESDNAYNNRGVVRQAQGDLQGAISDFSTLLQLRPHDARAYNNRCNARLAAGDVSGAITDCDRAIQADPQNVYAYANRGRARQQAGDSEGGLADLSEAIRLDPTYAKAFNNRGLLRYAKGDLEGAIADYAKAAELAPNAEDRTVFAGNLAAARRQLEVRRTER